MKNLELRREDVNVREEDLGIVHAPAGSHFRSLRVSILYVKNDRVVVKSVYDRVSTGVAASSERAKYL